MQKKGVSIAVAFLSLRDWRCIPLPLQEKVQKKDVSIGLALGEAAMGALCMWRGFKVNCSLCRLPACPPARVLSEWRAWNAGRPAPGGLTPCTSPVASTLVGP